MQTETAAKVAEQFTTEQTRKQIQALIDMGGTATSAELATVLDINDRRVIRNRFLSFNKKHPGALKFDRKIGYTWTGIVDILPEKKEDPKNEKVSAKNREGYPDPTMAKALRNVENAFVKCKPGDIWEYDKPYYGINDTVGDKFLVLNAFKGTVTGMLLVPVDSRFDPSYNVSISHKSKIYYVDARRVTSKAEKGFVRRVDVVSDNLLNDIRKMISGVLKLGCVETKTVEKIVEKEVPVEVEKVVEKEVPVEVEKIVEKIVEVPVQEPGMVYISEVEYEVLKEKANIWEEAFRLMSTRAS